ncbi:ATP-dependent helicase [Helicobacter suis]|uniref:ATP-dependent helicase n=1 Tax=Helicobacter suis TaxID=104628 RepID=UPI0013D82223|nr:ATP-dependent helicase [Helicobacter suis]
MQLNSEQLQAIKAPLGRNLVIASAGTGKTSTIVGRILHLLTSGIDPRQILLLTFTNKASQEMKERLARYTKEAEKIEAGTFHAVAYRFLKLQDPSLSLKQPTDMQTLLKSFLIETEGVYSAKYLYELYSSYLNENCAQSFTDWLLKRTPEQEEYTELYECALGLFESCKREQHYVDYNDLLILFKEQIKCQPKAFCEVLCDEYQDTNPLQDSILDALQPSSLFCVGDYDQSIYAFNGADISIISNFTQKYTNAQVFSLRKNYRSSGAILNLANRVIANNPRIYPKSLEVVKQHNPSTPKLLVYDELLDQYQGIAKQIALRGRFEEVAILFRNNASAEGCEAALRLLGIPSIRKGGVGLFDTKEVKLLLDVCAFLIQPKEMVATMQILGYGHGVGAKLCAELYQALQILGEGNSLKGLLTPNQKEPYPSIKRPQMGLFEGFMANTSSFDLHSDFKDHPLLSHPKIKQPIACFLENLYILCKTHSFKTPAQSLEHIIQSVWFDNIMQKLARERSKNKDGSVDTNRYEQALEKIKRRGELLMQLSNKYGHLKDFINEIGLDSREMDSGSGVHLLTVHASKGLEFSEVYVIDLMQKRFPNTKLAKQNGGLEEERRLFYVAVTRAKDHLYLSYAREDRRKNTRYEPSCFLKEAGLLQLAP